MLLDTFDVLRALAENAPDVLRAIADPPPWHADALCREHPEITWFPTRGESTEPARAICRRCLVREECATDTLETATQHGIWAGSSERQRRHARAEGWTPERLLLEVETRI